jgi:hypothetical protein
MEIMKANDEKRLVYNPKNKEFLLWGHIIKLFGVDNKVNLFEYFYSQQDVSD